MSGGGASSSPTGSPNKSETAIKAADEAAVSAGAMLAAAQAAGESPLEVFLTVMGPNARNLVSKLEDGDSRILEALKGKSIPDDTYSELTR